MSDQIVYKWLGAVGYVPGLPARDLTRADVDRLMSSDPRLVAELENSPLYEAVVLKKNVKGRKEPRVSAAAAEPVDEKEN